MKIRVIVHEEDGGGYWAEVPALPGCLTQGDTWQELLQNLYEAIEGYLIVRSEIEESKKKEDAKYQTIEIAV
ncbi:MAG: type II toxin-antitoxin system HicB family antitoxin [Candidatus Poribacteria bacterium]